MEKCHFVAAWGVAPGPCSRLFESGATIEAIARFVALLPFGDILADSLLDGNVSACFTQPPCKAWPLADQRLVADFNGGRSGDLVGRQ